MTARDPFHSCGMPGWWGRLLATLLFAFYVNFIPIHLATEGHFHDSMELRTDTAHHHHSDHHDHHHDSAGGNHHHDPAEEQSHRASDHSVTLTASTKARSAFALEVIFLPAATDVFVSRPDPQPEPFVFERSRPPADPPPDPLQPRAPPPA